MLANWKKIIRNKKRGLGVGRCLTAHQLHKKFDQFLKLQLNLAISMKERSASHSLQLKLAI